MDIPTWRVPTVVVLVFLLFGCAASPKTSTTTKHFLAGGAASSADLTLSPMPSSSPASSSPASSTRTGSTPDNTTRAEHTYAYRIGPLDVLEVSVFKVPELSKTVQVASLGTISLPLLGEVPAAGRTARDMEKDLTRKLKASYLHKPQVIVLVKEFNSQRVTVEGAVKEPGIYPIMGKFSLLQLIATAKGFSKNADTTVTIFRGPAERRRATRVDVARIRSGAQRDPVLIAGDVVVVSKSTLKEGFSNFLRALPIVGTFALL
ncbi:MAG: polysaccharide biosynthesis/export family protein [Pseudomonadota bacterium]